MFLSCEVIGRVDTHTPTSAGPVGKDPKLPPVHHFESRTLSIPKSFVKALVTRKDGTDLLGVLVQVSVVVILVCVILYNRKFSPFLPPALISKIFVPQIFLSRVEYVEPMVTFATWAKIHSTKYFCIAKMAG